MSMHPDDAGHVAGCAACQAEARPPADVDLGRVWLEVSARAWSAPRGPIERWVSNLLGSPGIGRALVTTPALFRAYLVATIAVLAAGALFERGTGAPLVALLAPALAAAGIVYAYGPGSDGAFELSRSMPVSALTILLARALAIFAMNALVALAASAIASGATTIALGWLAPMTAVCALALAVAITTRSTGTGMGAGLVAWSATVLASAGGAGRLDAATTASWLIPVYALVALACLVLAIRSAGRLPAAND